MNILLRSSLPAAELADSLRGLVATIESHRPRHQGAHPSERGRFIHRRAAGPQPTSHHIRHPGICWSVPLAFIASSLTRQLEKHAKSASAWRWAPTASRSPGWCSARASRLRPLGSVLGIAGAVAATPERLMSRFLFRDQPARSAYVLGWSCALLHSRSASRMGSCPPRRQRGPHDRACATIGSLRPPNAMTDQTLIENGQDFPAPSQESMRPPGPVFHPMQWC